MEFHSGPHNSSWSTNDPCSLKYDSFTHEVFDRVIAFRCAEAAGLRRIYAGQHFRTDHNAGKLLGQQVAESVIDTMLLPR